MRSWHSFGHVALALALTTLALSAAAQAEPGFGNLVAAEAHLSGLTVFDGRFIFLQRTDSLNADGVEPASDFHLTAANLRVETHESNPHMSSAIELVVQNETNNQTYANALVNGLQFNPGYKFHVLATGPALPIITIETDCLSVAPSQQEFAEVQPKLQASAGASPAKPLSQDTSSALQWTECSQGLVRIEGSFVLALWQVQAEIEANGERRELPSKYAPSENAPALYPMVSHARQQFLFAEDAVLTIPAMDRSLHLAFVQEATAHVDGQVTFLDASGTLGAGDAAQSVQARTLAVEGQLELATSFQSRQHLHTELGGRIDEAQADGQVLSFTATSGRDGFGQWGLILLAGAVLVPPILLAPRILRRFRNESPPATEVDALIDEVEHSLQTMRHQEALQLSLRLIGLAPHESLAHFLRAVALRRMGHGEQALEHHNLARSLSQAGSDQISVAEIDLEAARTAMDMAMSALGERRVHLRQMALEYLDHAAAARSSILVDLDVHPELESLYRDRVATVV